MQHERRVWCSAEMRSSYPAAGAPRSRVRVVERPQEVGTVKLHRDADGKTQEKPILADSFCTDQQDTYRMAQDQPTPTYGRLKRTTSSADSADCIYIDPTAPAAPSNRLHCRPTVHFPTSQGLSFYRGIRTSSEPGICLESYRKGLAMQRRSRYGATAAASG